jgi:hypothetical protein
VLENAPGNSPRWLRTGQEVVGLRVQRKLCEQSRSEHKAGLASNALPASQWQVALEAARIALNFALSGSGSSRVGGKRRAAGSKRKTGRGVPSLTLCWCDNRWSNGGNWSKD